MAHLSRISLYPIKSLDPVDVDQANVLPSGMLQHDRQFAIVDYGGKFLNGKRTDKVHRLRSSFDVSTRTVAVHAVDGERNARFQIDSQRGLLEQWLSSYFGMPVRFIEDGADGFPDDIAARGPTVISSASYEQIAGWFPPLAEEEVRRRFRANLEIADAPPFWEDRLLAEVGSVIEFQIGEVTLLGMNASARCVVPSRDPQNGAVVDDFVATFVRQRRETLPAWAPASRFDHFYRLAVNTRLPLAAGSRVLRVGDPVRFVGVTHAESRGPV